MMMVMIMDNRLALKNDVFGHRSTAATFDSWRKNKGNYRRCFVSVCGRFRSRILQLVALN